MDWSPEKYIAALNFASFVHRTQTVPGTENEAYLRHLTLITRRKW
jgi:protein subunit release factor A